MSTRSDGTARRRLLPEVRGNEIIRAGVLLFSTSPYEAIHMDDVAREAGVSRALLYKYFPNKNSLFVAVVNDLSDRMLTRTAKSIDPNTTPFEQVRTGVLGYLMQYEKHPYAADSIVLGVGATNPQGASPRPVGPKIPQRPADGPTARNAPPQRRCSSHPTTASAHTCVACVHPRIHSPMGALPQLGARRGCRSVRSRATRHTRPLARSSARIDQGTHHLGCGY